MKKFALDQLINWLVIDANDMSSSTCFKNPHYTNNQNHNKKLKAICV